MSDNVYKNMWEEFGSRKGETYLGYKFLPTHRIGLTNYLREEQIYSYVNPQKDDVVLDVGCAAGRQIFEMAGKIKEGRGVDIAESFVKKAREYRKKQGYHNTGFDVAVIEDLPFEDGHFTKLICGEVIEHVFDKDEALSELIRVVKPGGHIIISVPHYNADGTLWGRFLRLLGIRKFESLEHFSKEEVMKHGDAHVREFSVGSMTQWLESRGLKVIDITTVSMIDGPSFDFLLKFPLHVSFAQKATIWFEQLLSKWKVPLGRHIVVKCEKQG
jgi:ubiquinone/menaquinone biosynthesis C-methylase UbiE